MQLIAMLREKSLRYIQIVDLAFFATPSSPCLEQRGFNRDLYWSVENKFKRW